MVSSAKRAGFFPAHGIWCVSDGEVLVPLMGTEAADGTRKLLRFATEQVEQGVTESKEKLSQNPEGAARAVLVYDGFVTYETDARPARFGNRLVEPSRCAADGTSSPVAMR
jgi:hypothetical protein